MIICVILTISNSRLKAIIYCIKDISWLFKVRRVYSPFGFVMYITIPHAEYTWPDLDVMVLKIILRRFLSLIWLYYVGSFFLSEIEKSFSIYINFNMVFMTQMLNKLKILWFFICIWCDFIQFLILFSICFIK